MIGLGYIMVVIAVTVSVAMTMPLIGMLTGTEKGEYFHCSDYDKNLVFAVWTISTAWWIVYAII